MSAEYVDHITVLGLDFMMEDLFQRCCRAGLTTVDTKEEFYGFRSSDVCMIHYSKIGWRKPGVWFRLHDGRVVDAAGIEQKGRDADPAWYDVVMH